MAGPSAVARQDRVLAREKVAYEEGRADALKDRLDDASERMQQLQQEAKLQQAYDRQTKSLQKQLEESEGRERMTWRTRTSAFPS